MMVVRNLAGAAADVVNVCSHLSPSRIYRETDLLQSPLLLFSYRKSLISAILAISDICMHPSRVVKSTIFGVEFCLFSALIKK